MITFKRFEDRGLGLVAVFEGPSSTFEKEFALNEENLRFRVDNLRAQGLDRTVECAVLAEMVHRRKAKT